MSSCSTAWCAGHRGGLLLIDCLKDVGKRTVAETWAAHRRLVWQMQSDGKEITSFVGLDRYLEWSKLEDAATICAPVTTCQA
jgi:hypothetical protein